MWSRKETLYSQVDSTVKYIYSSEGRSVEVTYLRKGDGKDIVVVPTQTSCNLGCRFCHLTGLKVPVDSLNANAIIQLVAKTIRNVQVKEKTLLVSYMGSGEPLMNIESVLASAFVMSDLTEYETVRFAVASLIPSENRMLNFTQQVKASGLNFKFHWSLHSVDAEARKALMPAAMQAEQGIELVKQYAAETGRAVEIHYTLIEGVNDRPQDVYRLARLLEGTNITVKILRLSERAGEPLARSSNLADFRLALARDGVSTEYYEPPGYDIGAACGQFLARVYEPVRRLPLIAS